MVTNRMLCEAAGEAERAILQTVEKMEIEPHRFSNRFERKMNRLIRKVKYPIRYNIMRSAVAILLLVFILFGMLLAISPDVRASVVGWFKMVAQEFVGYSNSGNRPVKSDFCFESVPKGYTELKTIEKEDGKLYIYADKDGNMLQLSYAYGVREASHYIKADDFTHVAGIVNGTSADMYFSIDNAQSNVIIWCDEASNVLLCINAKADRDELIALAEKIIQKEK